MTSRERILLALNHKEADRVAICDGLWGSTVKRWRKEGMPEGVEPEDYFNYELAGLDADVTMQLPRRVIEETEDYIISSDSNGAVFKQLKKQTSTPEYIDFTVKDRKTWNEYRDRMTINKFRFDWRSAKNNYEKHRRKVRFICYLAGMGYNMTETMIGAERLLMAMVDDPGWVKEIFETQTNLFIAAAEEMMSAFEFDGVFLGDDMGYKNTSLVSPAMYKELFFPCHKLICDFSRSKGLPVLLHSCGCVKGLIPYFIEAGFACLNPLEVKAGMDLIELKKKYGDRLAFMGGIDVRKMKESPDVIEEEIKSKITFAKKGGGFIYHSDHSIPDDVSFQQYKLVLDLVHKYGNYEGDK